MARVRAVALPKGAVVMLRFSAVPETLKVTSLHCCWNAQAPEKLISKDKMKAHEESEQIADLTGVEPMAGERGRDYWTELPKKRIIRTIL